MTFLLIYFSLLFIPHIPLKYRLVILSSREHVFLPATRYCLLFSRIFVNLLLRIVLGTQNSSFLRDLLIVPRLTVEILLTSRLRLYYGYHEEFRHFRLTLHFLESYGLLQGLALLGVYIKDTYIVEIELVDLVR